MTNTAILSISELNELVARVFKKHGVQNEHSELIARHLVLAEVDGQKGHGLSRIESYLTHVKSKKVNLEPSITLAFSGTNWLKIDADYGFAYPALERAFDATQKSMKSAGAMLITIAHSHHAGVLGHHVERYAEQGLIALMFANTPAAIAPWNGAKPVFGTNPIAFACPRINNEPLVIDLSLSKVARGKIMRAAQVNEDIPEGWALDKNGNPTTDALAALEGTMLPMGDAKGASLALLVEIMTAGISGSSFGYEASSFFNAQGDAPNVSQSIILIKPSVEMIAHYELLFENILSQEGTRLQGEIRIENRKNAKVNGVEILQSELVKFEALADQKNIRST